MVIDYVYINCKDGSYELYKEQYIELYRKVYAGSPFYEKFSRNEIVDTYKKDTVDGSYLCCAINDSKVVGFIAGRPLQACGKEMQSICGNYFEVSSGFYNSSIAVDENFRCLGIGSNLIDLLIKFTVNKRYRYYVLRTNKHGSMSESLYSKKGFSQMSQTMYVSQPRVRKNIAEMDERVLLWKEI